MRATACWFTQIYDVLLAGPELLNVRLDTYETGLGDTDLLAPSPQTTASAQTPNPAVNTELPEAAPGAKV